MQFMAITIREVPTAQCMGMPPNKTIAGTTRKPPAWPPYQSVDGADVKMRIAQRREYQISVEQKSAALGRGSGRKLAGFLRRSRQAPLPEH
jgi:hypothetical protein